MDGKAKISSRYCSFSDSDNIGFVVRHESNSYFFSVVLFVEGIKVHLFQGFVYVCSICGHSLNESNKSPDSDLCRKCFDVDRAELEAEDLAEDSMTDDERLADFLG
jgi:hypothetical protein